MTTPPIWKWRPSIFWHRTPKCGWEFCLYQHRDHNPVIVIARWMGKWRFEFYRDYFYMRSLRKKYGKDFGH
jgi:hypothetical protein